MKTKVWKDHKGRIVPIHTMSNRWLNNLRKWFMKNEPDSIKLTWIKDELKRRTNK